MGASVSVAQGAPLDAGTYKADEAAVERFCELLRIPTVSRENIAERDDEPFGQWIPTLQRLYPRFFDIAEITRIDDFGMLLHWHSADSALDPIVMMAHQDVARRGPDWEHDPFGAEIFDGEIWARGSLDTKCIVSAFLEAAEHLIARASFPRAMSGSSRAMARKSPRLLQPMQCSGFASTTSIPIWCSMRVAPWQPTPRSVSPNPLPW